MEETPLELRFQPWQFDPRLGMPVDSVDMMQGGFGWEEIRQGLNICGANSAVGRVRWIPAFATNDAQVRAALITCGWRFLHGVNRYNTNQLSTEDIDWHELDRDCTEKALAQTAEGIPEHEKPNVEQFQRALRKAGSYLALLAGIVLHYWRRAQDCIAVAGLVDMTPLQVRQAAMRMVQIARELGFETFKPSHRCGQKMDDKTRRRFLKARQATIRRKMYGNPEFDETVQCWICKVNPKKPGNKWHCEPCAASEAQSARRRYRLAHGLPLRRHLRAKHAKA